MKKILISAVLFLSGLAAFTQPTVNRVETVPVTGAEGIEGLVVEVLTPSAADYTAGLPAGALTYRVFVNLTNDYGYSLLGYTGNDAALIPFEVTSTTPFFNFSSSGFGGQDGSTQNPAFWSFPGFGIMRYDSYGADGRIGTSNVGIPFSLDTDGTVDGITAINAASTPLAGLIMPISHPIFLDNTTSSMIDLNGGMFIVQAKGPTLDNMVFVMQLTTAGDLTFTGTISVRNPNGVMVKANHVGWSSVVIANQPPVVSVSAPASAYKDELVTFTADASDPDGQVASVDFMVNGSSIGVDTDGTDGWSYAWTAAGGPTVEISALATDNGTPAQNTQSEIRTMAVVDTNTNAAPVVNSLSPSGFNIKVGNDTTFVATVSDADGSVSSVNFRVTGAATANFTDNTAPFEFTYTPALPGSFTLTAIATDNDGAQSNSETASFVVEVANGDRIVFDLEEAIITGQIIEIPVMVSYDANLYSIDFDLDYDSTAIEFVSHIDYAGIEETVNAQGANIKFTSYSLSSINTSEAVIGMRFNIKSDLKANDFSFTTALLNGNPVNAYATGEIKITAPVINLNGENPMTISYGDTYVEPGATATDFTYGDISADIVISGIVNTSAIGTYIISYNVSNALGNAAEEVTRTVNVIDDISPVITLVGNNPMSINLGTAYIEPGANAIDNVDGNISHKITISGNVNFNQIGTYILYYNVSDTAGNIADELTRTVYVVNDQIAPVITLLGENPLSIDKGEIYTEPGATATDNIDGDISNSIVVTGFINTYFPGIYQVKYNVSDAAGNNANEVIRTVNVIDNTSVEFTSADKSLIYPNPANNMINVAFSGIQDVALVNLSGQIIEMRKEVDGFTSFDINELNLKTGVYSIQINQKTYQVVIIE